MPFSRSGAEMPLQPPQNWHANPTQSHQLHAVDWTTLLGIEGHLLPVHAYSLHRWINKTIVKMKGKPWQASPSRFRTTSWSRPPLPHPKHGATASPPTPGNPRCPQPPPLALPRWPQPGAARAGWAPAQAQRRRKRQSLAPGQRVKRRKAWSGRVGFAMVLELENATRREKRSGLPNLAGLG